MDAVATMGGGSVRENLNLFNGNSSKKFSLPPLVSSVNWAPNLMFLIPFKILNIWVFDVRQTHKNGDIRSVWRRRRGSRRTGGNWCARTGPTAVAAALFALPPYPIITFWLRRWWLPLCAATPGPLLHPSFLFHEYSPFPSFFVLLLPLSPTVPPSSSSVSLHFASSNWPFFGWANSHQSARDLEGKGWPHIRAPEKRQPNGKFPAEWVNVTGDRRGMRDNGGGRSIKNTFRSINLNHPIWSALISRSSDQFDRSPPSFLKIWVRNLPSIPCLISDALILRFLFSLPFLLLLLYFKFPFLLFSHLTSRLFCLRLRKHFSSGFVPSIQSVKKILLFTLSPSTIFFCSN